MKLTLVRRQTRTHDTESFLFQPEQPFSFKPGQFLRWNLPHPEADDRGESRFFTISSSPTEPEIMLTTKFTEGGSTFKETLKKLAIGHTVEVGLPLGGFVLPDDANQPVVLVAGGVGITPYRSMLKWMVDTHQPTPVWLVYGLRSDQDMLFREELDSWAASTPTIKITYVPSQPPAGWTGETGNLSAAGVLRMVGSTDHPVYLSGPEPMIQALKQQFIDAAIPESQIKTDFFPGYSDV